mgnify:CR=1 FL=1
MSIRNLTLLSAFCAGAILAVSGCAPYSTGPTEVGVRTVKWSMLGNKGVQEKVYEPGTTHFFVPFLNDWHTFDTRLQKLEMVEEANRGDRRGRDELLFKTIDGNDISLDVVISYRIIKEKVPLILQEVASNDAELKEAVVRTITRSKPRDIFGELRTEEFYEADDRTAKAQEAQKVLNGILEPYGVYVERVGTLDYRFNPAYQKAIEDKKVADQQAEKIKSETDATEAEYVAKVEKAKAEVAQVKTQVDGEYKRAVIEADAYFEQQSRVAEAVLAEARAEAEAIYKMNEALAGPGGEAMVRLKIAEALGGKRVVMLPMGGGGLDVRSTDINDLLDLYGIKGLIQGPAQVERDRKAQSDGAQKQQHQQQPRQQQGRQNATQMPRGGK